MSVRHGDFAHLILLDLYRGECQIIYAQKARSEEDIFQAL